jgi:hypothetical protein
VLSRAPIAGWEDIILRERGSMPSFYVALGSISNTPSSPLHLEEV